MDGDSVSPLISPTRYKSGRANANQVFPSNINIDDQALLVSLLTLFVHLFLLKYINSKAKVVYWYSKLLPCCQFPINCFFWSSSSAIHFSLIANQLFTTCVNLSFYVNTLLLFSCNKTSKVGQLNILE